jgi:hypothetical protein
VRQEKSGNPVLDRSESLSWKKAIVGSFPKLFNRNSVFVKKKFWVDPTSDVFDRHLFIETIHFIFLHLLLFEGKRKH